MQQNVKLAFCYVLRSKPYGNTSALVDIFSREHGRLTLIAKGARAPKSPWVAWLQPFQLLRLSWQGQSELKTLTSVESTESSCWLQGLTLYSGLYLNELLLKFLQPYDAHPSLFDDYHQALRSLTQAEMLEATLRRFEMALLCEVGYGLPFADLFAFPIDALLRYGFDAEQGWVPFARHTVSVSGQTLLEMREHNYARAETRQEAKRLMRYLIDLHLGGQTLHTRRLLQTTAMLKVE
jgi:DNA repair protein RecO (recombination protein O)